MEIYYPDDPSCVFVYDESLSILCYRKDFFLPTAADTEQIDHVSLAFIKKSEVKTLSDPMCYKEIASLYQAMQDYDNASSRENNIATLNIYFDDLEPYYLSWGNIIETVDHEFILVVSGKTVESSAKRCYAVISEGYDLWNMLQ